MNHKPLQSPSYTGERASPLLGRRAFFGLASGLLAAPLDATLAHSSNYPTQVAGVQLPRTAMCGQAYELCQSAAPAFLINHSLRTYVFGALHAAHHRQPFNTETAFVAAILHDMGLLKAFSTKEGSFETDGADRAERLVLESGASTVKATGVWNAIVMHDMRFTIPLHQSPEATLVAAGAGADVIGPNEDMISAAAVREVVAAIPRLQFKQQFIALLANHSCESRVPKMEPGSKDSAASTQTLPPVPPSARFSMRHSPDRDRGSGNARDERLTAFGNAVNRPAFQ